MGAPRLEDAGTWKRGDSIFSFPFWCKIQKEILSSAVAGVQLHKEENNLGFSTAAPCGPLDAFTASCFFVHSHSCSRKNKQI